MFYNDIITVKNFSEMHCIGTTSLTDTDMEGYYGMHLHVVLNSLCNIDAISVAIKLPYERRRLLLNYLMTVPIHTDDGNYVDYQ